MKVVYLLIVLIASSAARKIKRIIRNHYPTQFNYKDDDFKAHVDEQFEKFNTYLDNYKDERVKCAKKYLPVIKIAKEKCVGAQFEIYERGFDLIEFKMNAIMHHLLDLAFNENCMDIEENHGICVMMLEDIKLLILNNYNVVKTLDKNRTKYMRPNFGKTKFYRIVMLVEYLLDEYHKFTVELPQKRMVIKGLIYSSLVKDHESGTPETDVEDDEHSSLLEEEGGADKYYLAKVKEHLKNKYSYLKEDYQKFIRRKNMENPYKAIETAKQKNKESGALENSDKEESSEEDEEDDGGGEGDSSNMEEDEKFKRNLVVKLDRHDKTGSAREKNRLNK